MNVLGCTSLAWWLVDILEACGRSGSRYRSGPRVPPDVLVYTLAPDSDAELRGKDGIHAKGDLLYMEDSERIFLSVVVTVGVRGPQGWRCSWLQ